MPRPTPRISGWTSAPPMSWTMNSSKASRIQANSFCSYPGDATPLPMRGVPILHLRSIRFGIDACASSATTACSIVAKHRNFIQMRSAPNAPVLLRYDIEEYRGRQKAARASFMNRSWATAKNRATVNDCESRDEDEESVMRVLFHLTV